MTEPGLSSLPASSDGAITVGEVSGTGIAIGHGASVTVINQVVQGLGDLLTGHDVAARNFLVDHVGTEDQPRPFGGRQADLERLDHWLQDVKAPHYALLAAPAGQGKSGLLAHWVVQLQQQAGVNVVFFPISLSYGTNREDVVFAALAARLARVYGEPATRAINPKEYRSLVSDFMGRRAPPADGRPVLIVLDALDEASGWQVDKGLFPTPPPSHLRVVLSVRSRTGEAEVTNWLERLGWQAPGRASHFSLGRLDDAGVRGVLQQLDGPAAALADKPAVVARLCELSDGTPLLIRLYRDLLPSEPDAVARFTANDLAGLRPGFGAYFDLWFEQQESLWQSGRNVKRGDTDILLAACATALGPLTRTDLLALAAGIFESGEHVRRIAQAAGRFLIGDGDDDSGYAFFHSRLREYYAAERLEPAEREAWQERYLHLGQETLQALQRGALKPAQAPSYAVHHYSEHLEAAHAAPEPFYALLCEGWLRAWEAKVRTLAVPGGFVTDARRAWKKAEQAGKAALGQQLQAALCVASAASLSQSMPPGLIVTAIRKGRLSTAEALSMARTVVEAKAQAETLRLISAWLSDDQKVPVLAEALRAAQAIGNEWSRAQALAEVAAQLPADQQAPVLADALQAARAIGDDGPRVRAVSEIATHFPTDQQAPILMAALRTAQAIGDDSLRADALAVVAAHLPNDQRAPVLDEALRAAQRIGNEWSRAQVLVALAAQLPAGATDVTLRANMATCSQQDRASRSQQYMTTRLRQYVATHFRQLGSSGLRPWIARTVARRGVRY